MSQATVSPARWRGAIAASVTLCALVAALGPLAGGAAARVVSVTGAPLVGVQPRAAGVATALTSASQTVLAQPALSTASSFNNSAGNPVVHKATAYLIYWDPSGLYLPVWQQVLGSFFTAIGEASSAGPTFLGQLGQYGDHAGPAATAVAFGGPSIDTDPYPASGCTDPQAGTVPTVGPAVCLTAVQVQAELARFVERSNLPVGLERLYFLATPPGVTVCLDAGGETGHCSDFYRGTKEEVEKQTSEHVSPASVVEKEETSNPTSTRVTSYRNSFCSYHSYAPVGSSQLLYAVLPWTAGGLDDLSLPLADQVSAYECQDGRFNPVSKPEPELLESSGIQQEPNQAGETPQQAGLRGLGDLIVTQAASELQDMITDPLLNAWQGEGGNEVVDECRYDFAPASGSYTPPNEASSGMVSNFASNGSAFLVNDTFDLVALHNPSAGPPCGNRVVLNVKPQGPTVAAVGQPVAFSAGASEVSIPWSGLSLAETGSYATYYWNFGDGTPTVSGTGAGSPACATSPNAGCAVSVVHTFATPGHYTVTLTIKDAAGNEAKEFIHLNVEGTAPPAPASGSGSSGGGASPTPTAPSKPPAPKASVAVLRRSLAGAFKHGVAVRYTVDQQVAGQVQVLIAPRLAHRLRLRGMRVKLAKGRVGIVVGRAFVVTRGAGHGLLHVRLRPLAARKLRRLGKVRAWLRFQVHSAQKSHPLLFTVVEQLRLGR